MKFFHELTAGVIVACSLSVATVALAAEPQAVIDNYAKIAHAKFEDSLIAAQALDAAIEKFTATPSVETLEAAREAWRAARVPYQQTEVYRFGNPIVDEWEGRVNAWPLDEGLMDYVDASYGSENDENDLFTANVIANPKLKINGKEIDATNITPDFLKNTLHEAGGVESNVATGYHAIEFLLWGQDLNGTDAGAGERRYTDYHPKNCSNGNCDRRAAYLNAASDLLVADLDEMVVNWVEGGAARKALAERGIEGGLSTLLTGMGSLSYGELAGERMKLGLLLHDPEEEHDCFSDNTHISHLYDVVGIENAYLGKYTRLDGTVIEGASLHELLKEKDPKLADELSGKLAKTVAKMREIEAAAVKGEAYDQQIGEGNAAGNARVQAAIDGLIDQTKSIERAVAALNLEKLEIEGSDSLDKQDEAFK